MAYPEASVRIPNLASERTPNGIQRLLVVSTTPELVGANMRMPRLVGRYFDMVSGDIKEFDSDEVDGVLGVAFVNVHTYDCDTVCDDQTGQIEEFTKKHPEITIVSGSVQPIDDLKRQAIHQQILHPLVSFTRQSMADIGAGLEPDEGADEAYNDMGLRTAVVREAGGIISHLERQMLQHLPLNLNAFFDAAVRAQNTYMAPF